MGRGKVVAGKWRQLYLNNNKKLNKNKHKSKVLVKKQKSLEDLQI